MSSGVLNKFGLEAALRNLAKKVNGTGHIEMEVLSHGLDGGRLDYDVERHVYRIVQEVITNTLKHAQADHLTIQLIKKGDVLGITAEDNGKGFDLSLKDSASGIGLKNIEARVEKLNGELTFDSSPGHGFTVVIDIPVNA